MTRQQVQVLKRQILMRDQGGADGARQAAEAAATLLARSVALGHRRLAILRLELAVRHGAAISPETWRYCRNVAQAAQDPSLRAVFLLAEQLSGGP